MLPPSVRKGRNQPVTETKHEQERPSVARILGELRKAAALAEQARQAGDLAAELRARGEVRRLAETFQTAEIPNLGAPGLDPAGQDRIEQHSR